eukprot:3597026-Rhodomonas_salina.1
MGTRAKPFRVCCWSTENFCPNLSTVQSKKLLSAAPCARILRKSAAGAGKGWWPLGANTGIPMYCYSRISASNGRAGQFVQGCAKRQQPRRKCPWIRASSQSPRREGL